MQSVVLFDAVGTIIAPDPIAPAVYEQVGQKYGAQLGQKQVASRFAAAFKLHFRGCQSIYNQPANDEDDKSRWQRIVRDVFEEEFQPQIFAELWEHFALPSSWRLFSGVPQTIEELQSQGYLVGVASNFDSRIRGICKALLPMIPEDRVYYSTQVGFAKPDVRFYREIEKRIASDVSSRFLMIGDNWQYDFEAARRAGWRSIWKRREELPGVMEIQAELEPHLLRKT